MALVTVLSVMNGFERELQNNILGANATGDPLRKTALDPQQHPANQLKLQGVTRIAPLTTGDGDPKRAQRGGRRDDGH